MRTTWCLGILLTVAVLGCHGTDALPTIDRDAGNGEIRIGPTLVGSGQLRIEPVTTRTETIAVRTSGKAGFNEERLSYVSSPLIGRVTEILARPGDTVAEGQPLAVIDSPDLGVASSEFIKARADLILAERSYKLAQELSSAKAMARKDFQKAEDDFVKAKADLRRTRERQLSLGVAESVLDTPLDALHVRSQFNLSAPISGTVVERNLTLGQIVGGDPAQRLYIIADLTTLWVTADIYEKDQPSVHSGDEVTVQAGAWPEEEFTGRIDYVGATVDPNSRTVKVRASVDNRRQLLKPGMFVTATVHTAASATMLTIPLAAVHGEGSGQPYVFSALDDTRFIRRPVTLGPKLNDRVAVTAGLSAQDRIATEGSILLKAAADQHPPS